MFKPEFPKTLWARAIAAMLAAGVLLSVFILICGSINRNRLEGSFKRMATAYPELVVARVSFSKYLVQGTLPDNDPHFARLDIWRVRGTADIQFDLSGFSIDRKKTDYLNRILALSYQDKTQFKPAVALVIEPGDIRQVESIRPQSYTDAEMKKFAGTASLYAGTAGAFTGGTAALKGSSPGMLAKLLPVLQYQGGLKALIGAAAGGALAAGTAYCFTDDFIEAMQTIAREKPPVMDMLAAAKPLMEAEIAGTETSEREYRAAFESRVLELARKVGWSSVEIDYRGKIR
jgi:hypothetical protein